MKELCIPLPHFMENQIAEVEVTINGKKKKYNFRVESFPWDDTNGIPEKDVDFLIMQKIESLRNGIKNYDKSWELIQIYTPQENAKYIQILFRQKNS